jgi:AraC-like DNA-binding protein
MKHAIFLTILDFVHKLNSQGNEFSLDVSKILNFIDNNITTQLSLDTIAAEFSYNKDYILREFKKKYGITISKYINNKKIALAKTYLTMSDMSISKIANSVGFPTSLLFEKFFKYHVKISPSKYRKMFK